MNPPRLVIAILAVALGLWLLWGAADRMYFSPRAALKSRIASLTESVAQREDALDARSRLDSQLRRYVDRTLGPDVETADHVLRTRLNRLTEEIGVRGASVSTSSPSAVRSPARSRFTGAARRELREEIDFVELEATVSGEGSLEQIITLVDRLETERWIKRINTLRLDPKQNGERFGVVIKLTTLFLPGRAPGEQAPEAYEASRLMRYARLMELNPFHLPSPAVAAAAPPRQPQPAPAAPAAFPYAQWVVTGVAEAPGRGGSTGRDGAATGGREAWLRHRDSGETRRLAVGEKLHEAVLLEINHESVTFQFGDRAFEVGVGQHLGDRRPISR